VEIIIHHPWERLTEVEEQIKERFGLNEVEVLNSRGGSYEEILEGIGVLAAGYLDSIIKENTILGITWGRTIYHTVKALRPKRKLPITVVQVIGAAGAEDPIIDSPDLARRLASVYGGKYYYLHAPVYVANYHTRKMLIQEPTISNTLSLAERTNILLTGIGSLHPKITSSLWTKFLNTKLYSELRLKGAIGHLCAYFYDINGTILDIEMNKGIIGINVETLRKINKVIGVAGGEAKAEAILGAMRGKLINSLITDDTAALKVLSLDRRMNI
jgi:DNA-binding transcriptional regulator LsrR (DeoR family)